MNEHQGRIDPYAILAKLGDFPGARCTPLTGGADAEMWRVETPRQRYALRLLGPDQASQAEREITLSHWTRERGVPVPGVVASGTWRDSPAYLMDWVSGTTIAEAILSPNATPHNAGKLGREFGALQARIHALEPPPASVLAPRDWRTWQRLDDELSTTLDQIANDREALLHLDYHPLNVLTEHGEITAVLDWANAHIGDPRVDLARTCAILQLAPLPDPEATKIVKVFESGWRAGYSAVTDTFEIPPLYLWWAGAAMERNLTPKLNSPTVPWLTEAYIARIRQWTNAARAQALALD